jgi:hypothetical protein
LLIEIEAILEPLGDFFQTMTQKTSVPWGFATMPLIALLLHRYRILFPSGLCYPDDWCIEGIQEDVMFSCYQIRDGTISSERRVISLDQMSPEAQGFYKVVASHIIFRFGIKRENRFFYEILAVFTDPFMKEYIPLVFCEGPLAFNMPAISATVKRIINNFTEARSPEEHKADSAQSIKVVQKPALQMVIRGVDELGMWLSTQFMQGNDISEAATLKGFVDLLEKHDPLNFWSQSHLQTQFPKIYSVNLVTLAYHSSSAYAETLFSSSGILLTKQRNRLYESPLMLEAVTILKVHYTSEKMKIKRNRAQEKALKKQEKEEKEEPVKKKGKMAFQTA